MSVEINIPFFPGFYESVLSSELDRAEESHCEGDCQEDLEVYPVELQLEVSDYQDAMVGACNYSQAHEILTSKYVDSFDAWAGDLLGETRQAWRKRYDYETKKTKSERYQADSIGAKFSMMTSPREYNFETDRLFVNVSGAFLKRLFKMSKDDKHENLNLAIKEKFTSRDGFISHYSNRITDWTDKPLDDWDYNELGTLLISCLDLQGADFNDFNCYALEDGDSGYTALNNALDWEDYRARVTEKRAESLVSWIEDDAESVAKWKAQAPDLFAALVGSDPDLFSTLEDLPKGDTIGAFYHCALTPDLFATS
jgi:hypothetical protein